jgi:ACS family hexuronate transporter-like MFS transporter
VTDSKARWLALAAFVLSTTINYLDRSTLATLAPAVRDEFHLSHAQYGWIVNAFLVTYTLGAPFAGILIDRLGLDRAAGLAVGVWSLAGIATGLTTGLAGLVGCRALLGIAEAAGIPAAGKAIHRFLDPAERGLGNAVNQAAVSLGLVLAPPIAIWIAGRSGWRAAFLITGVLGLLWIPLWHWTSRRIPGRSAQERKVSATPSAILRDRRVWVFVLANALSMIPYFLWTNWTTLYLTDAWHMTLDRAKWYAAIPPVLAAIGGFAGGALSLRLTRRGIPPAASRFRVCTGASVLSLATAAIPAAPGVAWACAGISISFLAVAAFSVNMYSLPLDTFGGANAAFAISMLTASAGAAGLIAPALGRLIDLHGYAPVTAIAAVTPLAGSTLLWVTRATR